MDILGPRISTKTDGQYKTTEPTSALCSWIECSWNRGSEFDSLPAYLMYANSREGRGKAVGGGGWRRQAVKRFSHLEYFNVHPPPMERTVCQVNTVHGIQWREILEGQFLLVVLFPFSTFYNSHEMLVRKYSVLYFEFDRYCGTSLYCRGDDRSVNSCILTLNMATRVQHD